MPSILRPLRLRCALPAGALLLSALGASAQPTGQPLLLEAKIPLGAVSGRIDHLAVDLKRQRLFVAELGKTAWGCSIS